MIDFKQVAKELEEFLYVSVGNAGFKSVVLGLSGGIDSAVVAVLAHRVFGKNLHCILMPSHYSSKSSVNDALLLCEKFGLNYNIRPIDELLKSYENQDKEIDKLRIGNLSARFRMLSLFDLSAKYNALVLGTSNKSELLLGYGTIHGDLASAINPLGDLYKSEIFELAKVLDIPKEIIDKPPSADLWENQSDEDDFGFSYASIDEVLELIVEKSLDLTKLLELGYDEGLIEMLFYRISKNRFKCKLPLIAPIKDRVLVYNFTKELR